MNLSPDTGMDRFHGCYQWTNELSINYKRNRIAAKFCAIHQDGFKIGTWKSKLIGKLEIPETMVKTLNRLSIQKNSMVGDVTFNYCRIEFALFRHQKCPRSAATNDW
jgi:DNA polymerase-4